MLGLSDRWVDVIVAATGPAVTFLLGFLAAGLITARVQRNRRRADTRDALASEMYDVAGMLYFELQGFLRKAKTFDVLDLRSVDELKQAVDELDRAYALARRRGKMLEQRLLIYYKVRQPAADWHRVMDLLSVRYFLMLEPDDDARRIYREDNAGDKHSGLTAEQLDDSSELLGAYRNALPEAVASLWQHDLDWQGKHVRSKADVATWSKALTERADDVSNTPAGQPADGEMRDES